MSPYWWETGLALGCGVALLLASWTIARNDRANLARANFQRLVALDNQTFRDELAALHHEVARIEGVAVSTRQAVTSIGNVVAGAIAVIESRFEKSKRRIEELDLRNSEHCTTVNALCRAFEEKLQTSRETTADQNEISLLQTTIERIARFQKITEDRLADEIRFNIERSRMADSSLKGFATRIEAFAKSLDALAQNHSELSTALGALPQSAVPRPDAPPRPAIPLPANSVKRSDGALSIDRDEQQSYAAVAYSDDRAA